MKQTSILVAGLLWSTALPWSTALLWSTGCGGSSRTVLVPGPEVVGGSELAPEPYVVRMSDGRRDWEVEFPASANGYELRIPLRESTGSAGAQGVGTLEDMPDGLTGADRELLAQMRHTEDDMEREGVFQDDRDLIEEMAERSSPREPGDEATDEEQEARPGEPAPSRPSYLLGVNEVRRLYRGGNPEVAMIRLGRLLEAYPSDARLMSMKGTLWLRLGRPELARRAWEEVLHQEPDNRSVQAALQHLNTRSEQAELAGAELAGEGE